MPARWRGSAVGHAAVDRRTVGPVQSSSDPASTFAAVATGSQVGLNGGAYARSRFWSSVTVIPPWRAVATVSPYIINLGL